MHKQTPKSNKNKRNYDNKIKKKTKNKIKKKTKNKIKQKLKNSARIIPKILVALLTMNN